MPWGIAAGVATAAAGMYDQSQASKAQQKAIAPLQAANSTAYSKATDIANTPYTPYTGTQVAPITGSQQQAITQAQTAANNGSAKTDIANSENLAGQIAGNGWSSSTAQKYMSPYTQNVTDIAQRQLNKQYANTINAQGLNAASSGAFGGDRAALTNAATTQGYLQSSADTAAKGQADAYDNAVKTWQADNGRASTAAQAYSRAGNDITQMNSAQIKDLLATGGVAQATQQMDLNAKYNNYLDQRGWAANQLQPLLQATGNKGTPAAVPTANKASDLLGMGAALAGYFGSNSGGGGSTAVTYNPDASGAASSISTSGLDSATSGMLDSSISSDRRLKEAIEPLDIDGSGLMRYRFRYKGREQTWIGYMADEVQRLYPKAVVSMHGFLRVYYARIPGGLRGVLHG